MYSALFELLNELCLSCRMALHGGILIMSGIIGVGIVVITEYAKLFDELSKSHYRNTLSLVPCASSHRQQHRNERHKELDERESDNR